MIFGFNTDIRHADTVYHVQSEASTSSEAAHRAVKIMEKRNAASSSVS